MPTQITNGSLLLLLSNITVSGLVLHGGGDTTPLSILGDGNTVSSVLVMLVVMVMVMVMTVLISAANRLIGEVVQSRRRPLLVAGSPGGAKSTFKYAHPLKIFVLMYKKILI